MFTVQLKITGINDLLIKQFLSNIRNNRELWQRLLAKLRKFEQTQFDSYTGYVGETVVPWPPYDQTFADPNEADRYVKWKQKHGARYGGTRLLVFKGRLMDSLTKQTSDSIAIIRPNGLEFGTKVKNKKGFNYAQSHNLHKNTPVGNKGWRPFLHPNSYFETIAEVEVQKWADEVAEVWFR